MEQPHTSHTHGNTDEYTRHHTGLLDETKTATELGGRAVISRDTGYQRRHKVFGMTQILGIIGDLSCLGWCSYVENICSTIPCTINSMFHSRPNRTTNRLMLIEVVCHLHLPGMKASPTSWHCMVPNNGKSPRTSLR